MSSCYDLIAAHGKVLLSGVVGSHAYGLSTQHSDTDRLGVYAAGTLDLCGLNKVAESQVYSEPVDAAFHEAGKYVRLALACNPTVTELLWLQNYEVKTSAGDKLVEIRRAFLSSHKVKDSYLGYARSQLKKLQTRGDGAFSSDTKNRAGKHARHMARLVNQGLELYTTGNLTIKVSDPGWYHQFSEEPVPVWESWFEESLNRFERARTCLPENPDRVQAEEWLTRVRVENLPESITRRLRMWIEED